MPSSSVLGWRSGGIVSRDLVAAVDEADGVTVAVAHEEPAREAERARVDRRDVRGDERELARRREQRRQAWCAHRDLPMRDVVGLEIDRRGTPVPRRAVLEELDARAAGGSQGRDAEADAE